MMTAHSFKRTSRRRACERFPLLPNNAGSIEFPEHWKHLCGDIEKELFLLIHVNFIHDSVQHTVIVFGTEANFRRLCGSETWYMDGTFKSSPALFKQVFTIHYIFANRAFPALYCLLTGKAQPVYTKLFQEIRNLAAHFNVNIVTRKVMSDYETAIRQSILSVWNNFTVEGCLFHYTKCLRDKINSLGLKVSWFYKLLNTTSIYSYL